MMITPKYSHIHVSCLSVDKEYNNENIYFYVAKCNENMTNPTRRYFLHFDYLMILTPFDFLAVKLLNSYIFMSSVDART